MIAIVLNSANAVKATIDVSEYQKIIPQKLEENKYFLTTDLEYKIENIPGIVYSIEDITLPLPPEP